MKTLYDKATLHRGVATMAAKIEKVYEGRQLTIVGVLTGSVVLLADLIRAIEQPMRVGVIQASSYRGATTERGDLVINSELMLDISGRDVLLVDDIFDTGRTLERLMRLVNERGARSVRSAVLMTKSGCSQVSLRPDFQVFEIPDEFVVGYGLDHLDRYRNLPYVAVLESSDLEDPDRRSALDDTTPS